MFIYFNASNSVLTCEEYPQIFSIEYVKEHNLEHMCNRWIKNDFSNGTFTLSFINIKETCDCDKLKYRYAIDFENYDCYECGRYKNKFENNINLFLQNSGHMDILCVKPYRLIRDYLKKVDGYENVYAWSNNEKNLIFALHNEDGILSDCNIYDKINKNENIENAFITFVENI
jgi:hypothetical protein